ncbi:acyl carrier protein [Burkholderia sp. MS455]|uniref:acyl carrier protein n=1 Tax=Burkholderia sp. MS455 TaxID=2811788 RepID=UPI001957335E|nr:acyl carrier protein [Burkholderia sp. MS455]
MMTRTQDTIEHWLVERVSMLLKTSAADVDVNEQLIYLGVTSSQALALTADLEEYLGCPIDPAVMWEFPTIRRLAERFACTSPSPTPRG